MRRFQLAFSTQVLIGCLGIMSGLLLSAHHTLFSWGPLILSVATFMAVRKRIIVRVTILFAAALLFGWLRGSHTIHEQAKYQRYYGTQTTFFVTAKEDGVYGKSSQLSFAANNVVSQDGQQLPGSVQLSGFGMTSLFSGDRVRATGKLYASHGATMARMSFADLRLVNHHSTLVAQLRRSFNAGLQSSLPEPLAPFAMGLLIGQRANLPDSTKADLLKVGLTHIIAVSGYNLTIILQASRRLFGGRSKRLSTYSTVVLAVIFLLIAGTSPSIVRAAMISMLSLAASYYGRSFRPVILIALAAAITSYITPSYIWGDISWYLSFLAFVGVMIVAPLLAARLPRRFAESQIGSVAIESISAEIMTLPYVLYNFGQMSLIALPANVLVVAWVPLAMLLSLVAGISGMYMSSVAGWLAWPAVQLLNYMLDTARLLSSLPGVFVEHIHFSLAQVGLVYGALAIIIWLLDRKTNHTKYAKITGKND